MTACIIAFVIWISLVLLAPVAPWAFVRRLQRELNAEEVDKLVWLTVAQAVKRLTYGRDKTLVVQQDLP